jgi:hypothetical protein
VTVPEGMQLAKVSQDMNYSRPGMNLGFNGKNGGGRNRKKNKKR